MPPLKKGAILKHYLRERNSTVQRQTSKHRPIKVDKISK